METKLTELRRSKRTSHKIKGYDWFYLDFSDTESTYDDTESTYHHAKDELTGKGCVSHIEDIKVIEFETLEDMQFYDSVAEKIGNVCCASFNELYLPFRGFSEEECSRSETYLFQFKASSKYDVLGENHGSKKVPKPINKSKSKLRRVKSRIKFDGMTICEPHGEESCVSCSADAKSHNLKLSDVGSFLTPSFSPNTSFNNVTVASMELADSEFDKNIEEDLLLTPQGSPATSEQDPLCYNPSETMPIDFSAIPYIFKCSASRECLSSKACADISSHFTLCIQLTPGKGRALSKFAIKYLDQRQESNIVDRVSATIAASAVESSASTIFLPLSKDFICCAFPKTNLIHYLESPPSLPHIMKDVTLNSHKSEKLFECSNLEETPCDGNDIEVLNTCSDDSSNISPLSTKESVGSSESTNTIKKMKRKLNGSTPGPQMKKPLIDSSSSNGQPFHEVQMEKSIAPIGNVHSLDHLNSTPDPFSIIHFPSSLEPIDPLSLGYQEIDYEFPSSTDQQNCHPRNESNPSPQKCGQLPRSGSVIVTDSFSKTLLRKTDQMNHYSRKPEPVLSVSINKLPSLDDSLAKTGEDSGVCSLDKVDPRRVPTSCLSRFSSSSVKTIQPYPKKLNSSLGCPIHANKTKPVVTEVQAGHSRTVIDLTRSEKDTSLCQASTCKVNLMRANRRKVLSSSSEQLPEKVIVIDDNSHETGNQLEFNNGIPNIESGSRLQKLDSTIHHKVEGFEVSNPAMHSRKVNRTLDSNQKVIDLTECSGVDDTRNRSQSGMAKRPRSNSKEKVIDLTEGDEVQSPLYVEDIATSEQVNVVTKKDGGSNYRSWSKSYQVHNREEVIEDYSVKPCSGLQELAVMCTNVPSLGFIRVIRCTSGELMLNETFTARVYKQFEDLKALNSYLNLRFEKMPGVKDRGLLLWILATAGVIKLKKVRPINPKVWFHPNDYILTEDGPASVRMPVPSNLSKTKSCPNKTKSPLSNSPTFLKSKVVQITQTEVKNTLVSCSKSLAKKDLLIPVTTSNSPSSTNLPVNSDKQPRTARLVSVLLNKNDRQQLGIISNKRKHTNINKPIYEKLCNPQNKKLYSSSKNSGNVSPIDMNRLCTVSSSNTDLDITVPQPVISLSRSGTQSTGSVPSSSAVSLTSKSSTSQNVVIASAANPSTKPNTCIPNTYMSNLQPAVITNKKHCQTNQISPADRVQKIMDCKPNGSQIVKRLLLNDDPTSIPIMMQPSLQSKVHSSAAVKSSMGRTVLLIPNKNVSKSINKKPLTQTGSNNLPGGKLVQVGTSQNFKLIINSLKAQGCKVNQSSRSNTVRSVSLPNNMVGQSTSQESSNILRSTLEKPVPVLVDSRLNQAVKNHQYKVTPGSQQTSNATQSMATLYTKERPRSSNLENEQSSIVQKTQPMVVWAGIPSGQSKDLRKIVPMRKPMLDGQKCMSSNGNTLSCGNFVATSTHSMSQVPDRSPPQPTNLNNLNTIRPLFLSSNPRIQAEQISCSNVPGVVINKSITPQRTIIVSTSQNMNPPVKVKAVMSSIAQNSTIGKVNAARSVTLTNQHLNQTGTTEETLYPDAMIYFSTEAKCVKGIPVQKFLPIDPSTMNSSIIVKPRPEKSSGANVPTTKPAEFVKSSLPKVVYSKVEKGQDNVRPAPLKLHWATLNIPKPS